MPNREKLIVSHSGEREKIRKACMLKRGYCINFAKEKRELCKRERTTINQRAAIGGIHSKVLAHPDDAIGKVCGPENSKRVRGFSNATCPNGFGKSKRIFGVANCRSSSSASQQHVADLERQLQEAKDQVATLHRFLQHTVIKYLPSLIMCHTLNRIDAPLVLLF
ncbi:hypothetical protein Ahy_B01g052943 [Arachis hypogaea]|uniref:Uncharacterized protein n=1 Tax=Arachis hypogaea TaxID=3818 RepID=A0A445AQV3_ARAHY|nr:hypothetical protein Ahy_B01g052943 [Arachis hypogaea]